MNKCTKCGADMKRVKDRPLTPKRLKQKYYFTEWDTCTVCGYIQHYEKYRVETRNT